MSEKQHDLTSSSVNAALWGFAGSGARIAIQFLSQIVLARLLGPEQYGLYALGVMVIGFSLFFTDTGISYGLIQKQEITNQELRFAFTWQALTGGLITAIVILFSDAIATFFRNPGVAMVIRGLAIVCIFQACSLVSTNLLRRRLAMKHIQLAQALSYFIGYVLIGIPLALTGFQVWSLVIAWCSQAAANLAILYAYTRHPLRPLGWFSDALSLCSYGGMVFVTNSTNWLLSNIDRVVVGRYFPAQTVGLYTTSYNLMSYGTTAMQSVLQTVFFSAGSKMQGDAIRLGNATLILVEAIALLIFPIFASIAAVSESFIVTLYGTSWQGVAASMRPLALAMPFLLFLGVATPILWNSGRASSEWQYQVPIIFFWGIASWVAAMWSIVVVAWVVLALYVIRAMIFTVLISRALKFDLFRIPIRCLSGGLVGLTVAVVAASVDKILHSHLPVPFVLVSDISAAILTGAGLAYLFPKLMTAELASLVQAALGKVSPVAERWFGRTFSPNRGR